LTLPKFTLHINQSAIILEVHVMDLIVKVVYIFTSLEHESPTVLVCCWWCINQSDEQKKILKWPLLALCLRFYLNQSH